MKLAASPNQTDRLKAKNGNASAPETEPFQNR